MAAMEKTRTPGIYKRGGHYVAIWRHRGKQHKESFSTYELAREAKARRQAGDRRPSSKVRFGDYFAKWIETYQGRTARGLSEPLALCTGERFPTMPFRPGALGSSQRSSLSTYGRCLCGSAKRVEPPRR